MNKKIYNKLVRDRIPEIIRSYGRQCETTALLKDAYIIALREKLVEEAEEARDSNSSELIIELADLQEVMDALIKMYGFSQDDVLKIQAERRRERGGFEQRILLIWSEHDL